VFVAGMEETIFPHSRALFDESEMEEERRLCYVGMTRAKQELYLMTASSRMLYGSVMHNPPSRFLSEIDATIENENEYSYSPLGQTAPSNDEPRYVPELNEGDVIKHRVFSQGTVMEVDGDMASVYFKGAGLKKLNLGFAPVEKL
jgi:DNA helicase-2/ATP-dependent DNA helicase PcrA